MEIERGGWTVRYEENCVSNSDQSEEAEKHVQRAVCEKSYNMLLGGLFARKIIARDSARKMVGCRIRSVCEL